MCVLEPPQPDLTVNFINFRKKKAPEIGALLTYVRVGAEERTRTSTGVSPLPPQGSVSTNFTTSAYFLVNSNIRDVGIYTFSFFSQLLGSLIRDIDRRR